MVRLAMVWLAHLLDLSPNRLLKSALLLSSVCWMPRPPHRRLRSGSQVLTVPTARQSSYTCPHNMQGTCAPCRAQMRLQVGASWLQQAAAMGQSAAQRVLSGQSPFP